MKSQSRRLLTRASQSSPGLYRRTLANSAAVNSFIRFKNSQNRVAEGLKAKCG
jgi:hypothetical protein